MAPRIANRHRLTKAQRAELLAEARLPADERRTYRALSVQFGVSTAYINNAVARALLGGRMYKKNPAALGRYSEEAMTASVPHRDVRPPSCVAGVTLAQLMSGRARCPRRAVSA